MGLFRSKTRSIVGLDIERGFVAAAEFTHNGKPVLVRAATTSLGPGLFHNELVLVRTDGSGHFRRLLQHRSLAKDYWQTPRANLSYDGRFAAFSSNWGGTNRVDLFVARIDPPLGAGTQQTPAPPAVARPQRRPRRVNSN